MKGTIIYKDYNVDEHGATIYLFGNTEKGEGFMLEVEGFSPYFFIAEGDEKCYSKDFQLSYGMIFEAKQGYRSIIDDSPLTRVCISSPKDVPMLRNFTKTHEADIVFTLRFLVDRGIYRDIEVPDEEFIMRDGKIRKRQGLLYASIKCDAIKPTEIQPKVSQMCIDIECTNMKDGKKFPTPYQDPIVSIAYGSDLDNITFISWGKHMRGIADKHFDDEADMLQWFAEEIMRQDPSIIIGHNLQKFDLWYILVRMQKLRVPAVMGRGLSYASYKMDYLTNALQWMKIPGRQLVDTIDGLKALYYTFPSFALDYVCEELLGEKKLEHSMDFKEMYLKQPELMKEYNKRDVYLTLKLAKKIALVNTFLAMSGITGLTFDEIGITTRRFDSLLLREARKHKYVLPDKEAHMRGEYEGAYVFPSKPGVHERVATMDFKSLYPNCIISFNLSPETLRTKPSDVKSPVPDVWFTNEKVGILPIIMKDLMDRRAQARKDMKAATDEDTKAYYDRKQYALKIVANASYGAVSSPFNRIYDTRIGESITLFGQLCAKTMGDFAVGKGYEIIAGDTDSLLIAMKSLTIEDCVKEADALNKEMNVFHKEKVIRETGANPAWWTHDLQFEMLWEKVCFLSKMKKEKVTGEGKKKKYFGWAGWTDDKFYLNQPYKCEICKKETPEFRICCGRATLRKNFKMKGMEARRKDWAQFAINWQLRSMDIILGSTKEHLKLSILKIRDEIKDASIDDLAMSKTLVREIDDYKSKGPHVKAAQMLVDAGQKVHRLSKIRYLNILGGSVVPIELFDAKRHKIDHTFYLTHQVYPAVERCTEVFGQSLDIFLGIPGFSKPPKKRGGVKNAQIQQKISDAIADGKQRTMQVWSL
jgi:DNA polymerase elongation subunit (family B)